MDWKRPGGEIFKKAARDIDEADGLRACAPYLFGAFTLKNWNLFQLEPYPGIV